MIRNRVEEMGARARSLRYRGQGKIEGYPRVDMPKKPKNKLRNKGNNGTGIEGKQPTSQFCSLSILREDKI